VLDVLPHPFVRIELWGVRRQSVQPQGAAGQGRVKVVELRL
jgi:hypothetical protein